jgi:nucleotide-binding universal stress UspA family protein
MTAAAFKDLFVPLLRGAGDAAAIDAAVALATPRNAHLAVLVTMETPMPMITDWGMVPAEVNEDLIEEARSASAALAASARSRLARESLVSEVRVADTLLLWSEQTAALQARHADLSVIGGPDPQDTRPRFALTFKSLLLDSGRPVLMVPIGAKVDPVPRHVALAWKPTREATRALHDMLPLLARGTRVDVVMVDPVVAEGAHGEQPGADIARHLARHGLEAQVIALPREGRSVGECLLTQVRESGADWLVMGGYGHTRLREFVLGGCTRDVVAGARTPVLFSH